MYIKFSKEYDELAGLLTSISILEWQRNSEMEKQELDQKIKLHFEILDRMGVTYLIQNTIMKYGREYDLRAYYLDDVMRFAFNEVKNIITNKKVGVI